MNRSLWRNELRQRRDPTRCKSRRKRGSPVWMRHSRIHHGRSAVNYSRSRIIQSKGLSEDLSPLHADRAAVAQEGYGEPWRRGYKAILRISPARILVVLMPNGG